MATLKGSTIAGTFDQLVKRADTYSQTGTNIELMTDSSATAAPTGLYLESGATTDNVGIGTATPLALLELESDAGGAPSGGALNLATAIIRIVDTGNDAGGMSGILFGGKVDTIAGGIGLFFDTDTGNTQGDLVFQTRASTSDANLTEVMRIESSGKVGIGTASPD